MGGIGRSFGKLLGVKPVRVPDVTAPPKPVVVAKEDRGALLSQQARRNLAAQDDRSLLGTEDSEITSGSLLQNVNETATGINARDEDRAQVVSDHEENLRVQAVAAAARERQRQVNLANHRDAHGRKR